MASRPLYKRGDSNITKKKEKIALREGKRGIKSGGEGIAEKEGLQGLMAYRAYYKSSQRGLVVRTRLGSQPFWVQTAIHAGAGRGLARWCLRLDWVSIKRKNQ